jgi:superfamily II RNA helicase
MRLATSRVFLCVIKLAHPRFVDTLLRDGLQLHEIREPYGQVHALHHLGLMPLVKDVVELDTRRWVKVYMSTHLAR